MEALFYRGIGGILMAEEVNYAVKLNTY